MKNIPSYHFLTIEPNARMAQYGDLGILFPWLGQYAGPADLYEQCIRILNFGRFMQREDLIVQFTWSGRQITARYVCKGNGDLVSVMGIGSPVAKSVHRMMVRILGR